MGKERDKNVGYVYVIMNGEGLVYIGKTNRTLKKRLSEHGADKCHTTKGKGPWHLLVTEQYISVEDAERREIYLIENERGRHEVLLRTASSRSAIREEFGYTFCEDDVKILNKVARPRRRHFKKAT